MKVFTETLEPNGATLTGYVQEPSGELRNAQMRPAVLIFPGGSYEHCSDREAEPVALAYLAEGFNAFVLRYTVGKNHPFAKAFQDAQAALAYVRGHADDLFIDPRKVVVVGFSAGGHLAAAMGTLADEKPDALVLGYPATLEDHLHFLETGIPGVDQAVSPATPPTFIFSTADDAIVPVEDSLAFALALVRARVPVETHIYVHGAHGLSLAKPLTADGTPMLAEPDVAQWFDASIRFLHQIIGDFPLDLPAPDWVSH
ncbi:MAG: alpha/beta hydrolase [Propionibacteriaceae bacterium]|nr:alpha/beta hydrolase [Propionibacteriaceae bacterium]